MAIRRHAEGVLVIEQTRDLARVAAMLEAAGMMSEGVNWPAACYLMAFLGNEPVGVIGVEPKVLSALVRSVLVVEPMRKRGVGARLVEAARKAAHTRGARELYAFSTEAGSYFQRFGFERVPTALLVAALSGTPQVEYYKARPADLAREVAWRLDISRDGVIER